MIYVSNTFTVTVTNAGVAAADDFAVSCSGSTYDFGRIAPGKTVRHRFHVTGKGGGTYVYEFHGLTTGGSFGYFTRGMRSRSTILLKDGTVAAE